MFLPSFIQDLGGFSIVCVPTLAGNLVDNPSQLDLGDC